MTDALPGDRYRIMLCDCEGTNKLDIRTIEAATGKTAYCGTQLCRRQIDGFRDALSADAPLLIGCTQEAPLFMEVAEEADFGGDLRFVNIREKAGWAREGGKAAAKMAALIAEATIDVGGPRTVTLESDGVVLVIGKDDTALDAAQRLAGRMDTTLLLIGSEEVIPPRSADVPIFHGSGISARGHFGAFEVTIKDHAAVSPAARGAIAFEPAVGSQASSRCDILLDLRGDSPLFTAPDKRDGYFNPDPGDPAAVARTLFDIADLVGEFQKPRYVEYEQSICAHARNGITGCSRCLENCPTGAITPAGDKVEIDPFICAGCGNCASVCPTGAVRYTMPESEALLSRMRALLSTYRNAGGANAMLLIHDGEHGEAMIDAVARHFDGLPANILPLVVNAVSQCGLEALMAARVFGARHTMVLAGPKAAEELDGLNQAIELTNYILEGLGYGDGKAEAVLETDPEALAAILADRAAQRSTGSDPAAFHPGGGKRTLLGLALAALHRAAPAPVDSIDLPAGAPFGTVEVNTDNCTLCMSCAGACPTNALRDTPDYPRLSFVEAACVQCGICVGTCPEKVISLRPRIDFTTTARDMRVIKEEQPFECVRCGTPFATRSMIENVVQHMQGHAMFADEKAINRLRMCADCRVIDMAETQQDPFAAGERPAPRTTDDYLRRRASGITDDDDE